MKEGVEEKSMHVEKKCTEGKRLWKNKVERHLKGG